jgi:ribonuclease R
MIAANETVATHIFFLELPFLYRVHGEPNPEKIQKFVKFVHVLGYQINGKIEDIHPKTMQKILDSLRDKKEYSILSSMLLRSMQKAVYSKDNIGHFGLASKYYCHFTSPIRRYPDTTVHRLLRTYLFKGDMSHNTVNYWDEKLILLGDQTSDCERTAVDCEREVDDMKKAEYMEQHIGEVYTGMIDSVLSFGMFVTLPNLIEGLVRLDSMKDDTYVYDETTFTIRGLKHNKGYRIGDDILVRVIAANKEAHTIDFEIVTEDEKKLL